MTTYNDYQLLAAKVYDKVNEFTYTDKDNNKTTWKKVGLEFDADKNPTKFLEIDNQTTGYYGAVYGKLNDVGKFTGEYTLVTRGSDNLTNIMHDGEMAIHDELPPEFADALKLAQMAKTSGNGNLTFVGHSLGGTVAQLLALTLGGNAVTFNPYNVNNLTDSIKPVSQGEIDFLLQDKVDAANRLQTVSDNINLPAAEKEFALRELNNTIANIQVKIDKANAQNVLYQSLQNGTGSEENIRNYVIYGDPVSSWGAGQNDQPGETITITFESKEHLEIPGNIPQIPSANQLAECHGSNNFAVDYMRAEEQPVYFRSNQETDYDSSGQVKELVDYFPEKNIYEADWGDLKTDHLSESGHTARVAKEWEIYFVPGSTSPELVDPDRITEYHDGNYRQASFGAKGTQSEMETLAQELLTSGIAGDYGVQKLVTGDNDNKIYLQYQRNGTLDYRQQEQGIIFKREVKTNFGINIYANSLGIAA